MQHQHPDRYRPQEENTTCKRIISFSERTDSEEQLLIIYSIPDAVFNVQERAETSTVIIELERQAEELTRN